MQSAARRTVDAVSFFVIGRSPIPERYQLSSWVLHSDYSDLVFGKPGPGAVGSDHVCRQALAHLRDGAFLPRLYLFSDLVWENLSRGENIRHIVLSCMTIIGIMTLRP